LTIWAENEKREIVVPSLISLQLRVGVFKGVERSIRIESFIIHAVHAFDLAVMPWRCRTNALVANVRSFEVLFELRLFI
jgi:hypothetical protein